MAIEDMGLLDLLALEQSSAHVETRFDRRIRNALDEKERRIRLAAKHLRELGISEDEICDLVDQRVQARIPKEKPPETPQSD